MTTVPTRQLLIDFDNDGVPQSTDPYEDVTADLIQTRTIRMRHGRDQVKELSPLMAGFLEFVLGNTSLRYSDDYASSPIYGQVVPGRLVQAKTTFGQGYAQTVKNDSPIGYWRLGEAAPATLAADTFDRADSAVSLGTASDGGAWTILGGGTWGIASNLAYHPTDGGANNDAAVRECGAADGRLRVTLSTTGGNQRVCWRYSDVNNGWMVQNNGVGAYAVYKLVAGAYAAQAIGLAVPANGDIVQIDLSGSSYIVSIVRAGVTVGSYSGSDAFNSTATKHGIAAGSGTSAVRWDDWSFIAAPASAADASGNGNTGTYTGGVTLAQTGAIAAELDGTSDTAATLDASSGYVNVPNAASLRVTGDGTWEAWIKPTVVNAFGVIIGERSNPGNYLSSYEFSINANGGLSLGQGTDGVSDATKNSTNSILTAGVWQHVAVTRSGTTLTFYVNGVARGTATTTTTATDAGQPIQIGREYHGGGSSRYFPGTLDEVAVYATALSAARVLAHYNAGRDQTVSDQATYQGFEGYLQLPNEHPLRSDQNVSFSALDGAGYRLNAQDVETAMYTNIRTDVAIGYILDAVGWSATKRRLDTGAYTMPRWLATGVKGFAAIRDIVLTEGPPAIFYIDPTDGYAVFEGRHFRLLTSRCTTSQVTIRDTGTEPCYSRSDPKSGAENIVNSVTIKVKTWTPSAGVALIVGGAALPLTLPPNVSTTYAVTTAADAFDSAVASVTTTSGSVTTAFDRTSGKKATLTITAGASGATISVVGVTGTTYAITTTDVSNTPTTASAASIAKYGTRTLPDDFQPPFIGTQAAARDHGDYVVSRYQEKVPQDTIALNNYASARLVQALSRKISDRITKRNSVTGGNDDYFIEQIERQWQPGGNYEAALGIEKASSQVYWSLGVAGLGEIGVVSRLGF